MKSNNRKLKGMTLTELLVVLAIMGILILMAFPILAPLFQRAHATEAKLNLKHLADLQKVYFLEHTKYAGDFTELGFEQAVLSDTEGGTANYRIEILASSPQDFRATATAIRDFDGDGVFNVWEIDKGNVPREVVPD